MSDTTTSDYSNRIAGNLNVTSNQVQATLALFAEGGTVPFIARYRKEQTGSLDEVAITAIRDQWDKLQEMNARRDAMIKSLEERDLLTAELEAVLAKAQTMSELEDTYLPYRPKRRTRATTAIEKGLEPLADLLQAMKTTNPTVEAQKFVSAEKEVANAEDALAGARDILAERFSDDPSLRAQLRTVFNRDALVISKLVKGKEDEGAKFKDYFDWSEPASKIPSHRLLAMFRGEHEKILKLKIQPLEDKALGIMDRFCIKGHGPCADQIREAAYDSYKRLISRSLETELRQDLKAKADGTAIQVFVENLRELLLSPPLGRKRVLGLDPAFRTGCKTVCLDEQGKLLYNTVVYPHSGSRERAEGGNQILALCQKYAIEAIAIGNGTASRETEEFVKSLGLPKEIQVIMVNESGASIYSASDVARDEFPDLDLTVRSAVSIGRRLMDPLAELVKIDPKSIGVGQYQHDVDQKLLRKSLDDTVVSCVNHVGVAVNTASKQLLSYVAGLNATTAGNIVSYREENGPFTSRAGIKKVPRLGPKAYEQAAGFLRVHGGKKPLDASAVHPESYPIVDAMAKSLNCSVKDLIDTPELRNKLVLDDFVTDTCGLPTLTDIMAELARPGRDPREQFEAFAFSDDVHDMNDLKQGMQLPGVVTNVTAFGAFVDVGVHQDGLVHISQLADCYVKDPADIVKVQQKVTVTVMEVDVPRKRISLSMKKDPFAEPPRQGGRRDDRGHGKPQRSQRPQQRPQTNAITNDWFSQGVKKGKR